MKKSEQVKACSFCMLMEKTFGAFFKTVEGNEGNKCHYPTRLDTYGCGCQHDCKYCYAKSLLSFRDLWHPDHPSVVSMQYVRNAIRKLHKGYRQAWRNDGLFPAIGENT